jgi:hypothetical protein
VIVQTKEKVAVKRLFPEKREEEVARFMAHEVVPKRVNNPVG